MPVTINGSAGVITNSGAVYNGLQTDTAKTATSTSVDFTGIPSWVKRITVMFSGVSTNGTSAYLVQLGDSGGIENTGYLGSGFVGGSGSSPTGALFTAGFGINSGASTNLVGGAIVIQNLTGNTWAAFGNMSSSASATFFLVSGSKVLSDTLTQVRITTANGTDAFDAGSINIIFE
jgi:hypothetical protein